MIYLKTILICNSVLFDYLEVVTLAPIGGSFLQSLLGFVKRHSELCVSNVDEMDSNFWWVPMCLSVKTLKFHFDVCFYLSYPLVTSDLKGIKMGKILGL